MDIGNSFIAIRALTYMVMRFLGINRLFSFFVVIISYAFSQQWTALKEYSIFLGFIALPFFMVLWISTLKREALYLSILEIFFYT